MFITKKCLYYCIIFYFYFTLTPYCWALDTTLCSFTLDINRDKIVDSLKVKKVDGIDCPKEKCIFINMWDYDNEFEPDTQFILDLLMSNKKGNNYNRYILYSKLFFIETFPDSILSSKKNLPVSILTYKNKKEVEKECNTSPMGDIIVFFTPEGRKCYIFFNESTQRLRLCDYRMTDE